MTTFRVVVVVVGMGAVSRFWLPALRERADAQIVGVVEPVEARSRAAITTYGLSCDAYEALEVAVARTNANVVVNLTPPALHRDVVGAALALDCHVVTEKLMAATLVEAVELLDLAARTGKALAVMQNYRYVPGLRALKSCIDSGAVGEMSLLCADMFLAPRPERGSYATTMESPLLLDMAVHTFDQARFLSGLEPVSVYCHEFNPSHSWFAGAAAATCDFELSNGAVFSYRGSWVADGFSTPYHGLWRVNGSLGTALWDGVGDPACEVAVTPSTHQLRHSVRRTDWPAGPQRDRTGHADAIDDVFAALAEGRRPETDCTDNINSLAMVVAALASARERSRIRIKDVFPEATAMAAA